MSRRTGTHHQGPQLARNPALQGANRQRSLQRMASFRFLHCADLHIDSPLRGLEADPDAPAGRIRSATRDAFTALVDYAIAQQIDFVLAAGDLYDGEWQDWRTGQFLVREVGRLSR